MLAFLSGLEGIRATPIIPSFEDPIVYPTICMAPRMVEASWADAFSHLVLGYMMTGTERDLLTKFLKMKPPTFKGTNPNDTFEFIIDYTRGCI